MHFHVRLSACSFFNAKVWKYTKTPKFISISYKRTNDLFCFDESIIFENIGKYEDYFQENCFILLSLCTLHFPSNSRQEYGVIIVHNIMKSREIIETIHTAAVHRYLFHRTIAIIVLQREFHFNITSQYNITMIFCSRYIISLTDWMLAKSFFLLSFRRLHTDKEFAQM